jgi:hypothetical protein
MQNNYKTGNSGSTDSFEQFRQFELQIFDKYYGKSKQEVLKIWRDDAFPEEEISKRFFEVPDQEIEQKFVEEHMNETTRVDAQLLPTRKSRRQAAESGLTLDQDRPPVLSTSERPDRIVDRFRSYQVQDAALFSYSAGILGAAAFLSLSIGPGWLGFLIVFLPISALAAWAVSGHA